MRRLILLALSLALMLPGICISSDSPMPELRLIEYTSSSDHLKASELLVTHVFSSQVLGRALLTVAQSPGATEAEQVLTAELLLSKGAWINYPDASDFTPLMAAVSQGHFLLAEYLLEEGANPDLIDTQGLKAADFIAASGSDRERILALLEQESSLRAGLPVNPIIMNIRMQVQDDRIALNYDLVSDERACVVFAASNKEGENFGIPVMTVSGAVGCDVIPGRNLQVVWDALRDHSKGFVGAGISVELMASNF
jgi:hypothetical protein